VPDSLTERPDARLTARPVPDATASVPGMYQVVSPAGRRTLISIPEMPPGERPALAVMFHGAGGAPDQIFDLVGAEAARQGVVLVAPQSHGSTWDLLIDRVGVDLRSLDEALADVFARCPVDPARLAIGGFSDGASYALAIGLANGDLFSRILAFSPGFAAPPAKVGRPAVFISHGIRDRVLPIDRTSRRIVPRLEAADYPVTFHEFAGGHDVPPAMVAAAFDQLAGQPSAP
jgi:phospholipase/carboxylesterase